MKTKYFMVIFVSLIVFVILLGMDKCVNSGKYNKLKAEYTTLEKSFKLNRAVSEEIITSKNEEIESADKKIAELESTVAEKNEQLITANSEIAELEAGYDETAPPDEQIANLKQQVEAWKEKFHIAEQIIADKDKIIFSLNEKYEAQLVISNEYKSMYEGVLRLNENLKSQCKTLKSQVNRLRFGGKIKNGLILTLIGVTIYMVAK